jgi:hypothetical protein
MKILVPKTLIGAIGLRLGARAHRRQVAAGLRLGQVHGAGPLARHQLVQVGGFQLVAAGGQQRLDGAIGQQRAQREAHVGRVQDLPAGRADGLGQALAAKVGRVLQALPAAFGVLLVGLLEAGAGGDRGAAVAGRRLVGLEVERCQHALIEARAFFQHRLCGFQPGILETGDGGDLVDARQVLDVEQQILEWGLVAHRECPETSKRKGHRTRCPWMTTSWTTPPRLRQEWARNGHSALTSSGTASNRSATRP